MSRYRKLSQSADTKIKVCSISLCLSDRIRLIGFPIEITNAIRIAITDSWDRIQKEADFFNTYEFKLKGNPWNAQNEQAVRSRRLLMAILIAMAKFGWNLLHSVDVSKHVQDKDTLFFKKGKSDPDIKLYAMTLNLSDRIRIVDAPSSIILSVKDAIQSQWHKGIQKEGEYQESIEFKLAGRPWLPQGSEINPARMLLCQILSNFREKGYKL